MASVVFQTPLALKVVDLINSDPDAKDDLAALGVRDAVLECLIQLVKRAGDISQLGRDVDADVTMEMFFEAMNIMSTCNLMMLLIGQVPPKGRDWWMMEAGLLSQQELRLDHLEKFYMCCKARKEANDGDVLEEEGCKCEGCEYARTVLNDSEPKEEEGKCDECECIN